MSQQFNPEITGTARRAPRSVREPTSRRPASAAQVVIAWTRANAGATLEPEQTQVELEARLSSSSSTTWTSREPADSNWAEVLCAARCTEVLLSVVDDDLATRHLVFELAGLLTQKLHGTRPLIRVRFLPSHELARVRAKRAISLYRTG